MKKIILFCLLLAMSLATFSQSEQPSNALTKNDYLKKSHGQKTAAWILAGGGLAFITTGVIVSVVEASKVAFTWWTNTEPDKNYNAGSGLAIAGCVMIAASIPLFVISAKNKRHAMSLSFVNESSKQFRNFAIVQRQVPSLSLKVRL